MLDLRWATQYWPDCGFSVFVHALLNMDKAGGGGAFSKKMALHKAVFR